MSLLFDIAIIFAVSVAAAVICHRLGLPSTAGLLLAGVLAGPDALRLVSNVGDVERLSDIGVVLLLFVVGLEFSLGHIYEIRKQFALGGTVQMVGTALVVGVATVLMGSTAAQGFYLGFVVALSSTAIVLKMLQERAELDSPHGRMVLGTLVYQDIAVVPLMLAAPLLALGSSAGMAAAVGGLALRVLAVGAIAYVAYRWVVPWLLLQITATGSREAFLLGVLTICIAIALLTQEAGLSLALGAFLAGLIISESPYSHQAVSVILPFRDVFMSIFFVSLGMLLDVDFLIAQPVRLLVLTCGILVIKPITGAIAAVAVGLPARSAVISGMSLAQIGEFSLVATTAGVTAGLFGEDVFQTVLDTAVLSMLVAPLMMSVAPRVAEVVQRLPIGGRWRAGAAGVARPPHDLYDGHVVIVGFGVTGRNMARACRESGVPYVAVDMNAEIVHTERDRGEPIHYGDATHEGILRHVDADRARAIVIAINDPAAARRIVGVARQVAPDAFIIVRSRYARETEVLYALGADEVIADEVEVSIEVFSRVLARCLVPREDIEALVGDIRSEWREMARSLAPSDVPVQDLRVHFPELATRSFRLSESSPLAGRTIAECRLRQEHGVTVLAVSRTGGSVANPAGATLLQAGDVLFIIGPPGWDPLTVS